ncbi:phosphoribosylanthranilate isomerase [[Phormidium] sp. ETS-05]|uniref:phosphoribosylanthranilate isomerase n=1 Tax=[Phormidium] sp. ETS-05 TaxID=222819 RepID=UPI0018EED2B3|nr:phosphoribosylanthranilate isomerase [[Phormidium] sp. ETS-05]
MRLKICGITNPEQGIAIAQMGADTLGFICVPASKRYRPLSQFAAIIQQLPPATAKIGVFANTTISAICQALNQAKFTGIQLHGDETPTFCQQLRQNLPPEIDIIKALRIQTPTDLHIADTYAKVADTLLLDAYHPQHLGGTGQQLDWTALKGFRPPIPWFLAGGLTPDNIVEALSTVKPDGIDLSSGVEVAPGDKDLTKVSRLFANLRLAQLM